jgi:hypothetical protein
MTPTVPWLLPEVKEFNASKVEVEMAAMLFRHATKNREVLHRVDAWLDPASDYRPVFSKPQFNAASSPPPVPLRIGDVLLYNFWYLPIVSHTMVYVGAGHVVHYPRPADAAVEEEEKASAYKGPSDWVCIQHMDTLTPSQRRRLYVDPHNGYSRMTRYRVLVRALMSIGGYREFGINCNCQHITERIIGNKWFSIGIPRVVFAVGAVVVCCVILLSLATALLQWQAYSGSRVPGQSKGAGGKAVAPRWCPCLQAPRWRRSSG